MNSFPALQIFLESHHARFSLLHQVFLPLSPKPLKGTESCKELGLLLTIIYPQCPEPKAWHRGLKYENHICPFPISQTTSERKTGSRKEAALG